MRPGVSQHFHALPAAPPQRAQRRHCQRRLKPPPKVSGGIHEHRPKASWLIARHRSYCLFFPYLFPPGRWDVPIRISVCLVLVWFVTLVACIFRFRKKGLWFLVGAPLALYWPLVLLMSAVTCSLGARRFP